MDPVEGIDSFPENSTPDEIEHFLNPTNLLGHANIFAPMEAFLGSDRPTDPAAHYMDELVQTLVQSETAMEKATRGTTGSGKYSWEAVTVSSFIDEFVKIVKFQQIADQKSKRAELKPVE